MIGNIILVGVVNVGNVVNIGGNVGVNVGNGFSLLNVDVILNYTAREIAASSLYKALKIPECRRITLLSVSFPIRLPIRYNVSW
jgi:hypothetical protein